MSGAYQGAFEGSTLNNFIVRMSKSKSIGVVLLDEIDKAQCNVHSGLYQVFDKGEWTNKKLIDGSGGQTDIVSCRNIIFIMTTNVADSIVDDYARENDEVYTASADEMEDLSYDLQTLISHELSSRFKPAFLGRITCFVPFFPLSKGHTDKGTISREVDTIAKFLIERKQEDLLTFSGIESEVSEKTKERIVKIVAKMFQPQCGVRSIQKIIDEQMDRKVRHAALLDVKNGGITANSTICYDAKVDEMKVSFRRLHQNEQPGNDSREENDADFDEIVDIKEDLNV